MGSTLWGASPDALLTKANPRVQEVMAVQHAVTPGLIAQPEILGTAVGLDDGGNVALVVFVNSEQANPGQVLRSLPRNIKGVRVVGRVTEPFRALGKPDGKPGGGPGGGGGGGGGGGVSPTDKQTPPIKLGTSGGWGYDLANGYCCGGTLGSLVRINGELHILSNYHVLEGDIVAGGNNMVATNGSPVIQPGLIDVGCNFGNAQTVATLVLTHSLPNSNVDAAVAKVQSGMVDPSGAILGIGTISSRTVAPFVNQKVKKSGRTTGVTSSSIAGLNGIVSVTYENECAGGTAFTKTFTDQIIINNNLKKGKKFLAGGDSGSLMVEDADADPRAVGLLFAGSNLYAIANPIDEVLSFLGATMVGQ